MPDLQCTKGSNEIIPNCFDIYKIKVFKEISSANPRYNRLYPGVSINITQIYPPDHYGIQGEVIYDDIPADISGVKFYYLPLTFYNTTDRTYAFGFATVGVYI
jgi:hypothetical protein